MTLSGESLLNSDCKYASWNAASHVYVVIQTNVGLYNENIIIFKLYILIKQRGIYLLACLSGMAGHALYEMAPCFWHTGVTFNAENDRPGPGSLGYTPLLLSSRNICMCAFVW